MSSACTPILVGVTSSVSEIFLLSIYCLVGENAMQSVLCIPLSETKRV